MFGDIEFRIDEWGVSFESRVFDTYLTWDGVLLGILGYAIWRGYRYWAGA